MAGPVLIGFDKLCESILWILFFQNYQYLAVYIDFIELSLKFWSFCSCPNFLLLLLWKETPLFLHKESKKMEVADSKTFEAGTNLL